MKTVPVLLLFLATPLWAQGPLNPPGAPAPKMKTLGEIEPRTPVSSLPFTISASGSYYLTKDLLHTGSTDAISITAANVTLDLGGFALRSSPSASGNAILISSGLRNVRIRNGIILGNTTVAISGLFPTRTWTPTAAGFTNGIYALNTNGCEFSDLQVQGCRSDGLDLGGTSIIQRVHARENGSYGIDTNSDGNTIRDCTSARNGSTGIYSNNGVIIGCTVVEAGNNGIVSTRGVVTGCTSRANYVDGVNGPESSISGCTTNGNGRYGIFATNGQINLSRAGTNNLRGIGGADLFAPAPAVRFGNFPTP